MSSAPRERAGSAAPGPSVRRWERGARRRNWTWRRRAPQLSAGTPRPTPVTPPPRPRRSPFLPRLLRGPARVHPARWGAEIRDFPQGVRPIPGLSRPPPPLPSPSRARAARGGRRGRAAPGGGEQSEEERTVSREEPAPAAAVEHPLLPAPRTRRWRRQPREEEPSQVDAGYTGRHCVFLTGQQAGSFSRKEASPPSWTSVNTHRRGR